MVLVGTDPSRAFRNEFLNELQRLASSAREANGSSANTRATESLIWPIFPDRKFFDATVTVALLPMKWKAKRVEVALLYPDQSKYYQMST